MPGSDSTGARDEVVRSFAAVCGDTPRVLILGSMPGVASLRAQRYYAHPRNAFWPVMEALFGIAADQPYDKRMTALLAQGVAVWDVLASCRREGSLDSDIDPASARPNDLTGLLAAQPGIGAIFLNGGTAASLYRRHIVPTLTPAQQAIPVTLLPSTSPAHAGRSLAQKIEAWRVIQQALAR